MTRLAFECRPDNLAHGLRQVKCNLLDGVAKLLANPLQDGDNVLRFCARDNGNQGSIPCIPTKNLLTPALRLKVIFRTEEVRYNKKGSQSFGLTPSLF